ncbi:MAG TPA: hypothetical protein VG734_27310 [Lacunisphaera sp.]|nr:hypothetical protein [Lacunisphaera sp.]
MKFDDHQRRQNELLQVIRVAKLAYAYQQMGKYAARITRAGLRGEVILRGPDPTSDYPPPVMLACGFNQSVLDEHFLPEDIAELHAVLAYLQSETAVAFRFRLEDIGAVYLPAFRLAEALARKGLAACSEADFETGDANT